MKKPLDERTLDSKGKNIVQAAQSGYSAVSKSLPGKKKYKKGYFF